MKPQKKNILAHLVDAVACDRFKLHGSPDSIHLHHPDQGRSAYHRHGIWFYKFRLPYQLCDHVHAGRCVNRQIRKPPRTCILCRVLVFSYSFTCSFNKYVPLWSTPFLLGVGEGGCFPGAIKAVIEWIPSHKHAIANGIAIGGSAIGAVVAVPLCAFILSHTNWRMLFLISGALGIIWVLFWLRLTNKYSKEQNTATKSVASPLKLSDLIHLLKNKNALLFILIRFLLDPIFYFYMFWIPKYLNESKGLSLDYIGNILWIPFLALGIANIIGGWLSDQIQKKTGNTSQARKSPWESQQS